MLAATFFPDLKRPIMPNDAIDFLHAAIPVAYCDAVLLDGGTADRIERARWSGRRRSPSARRSLAAAWSRCDPGPARNDREGRAGAIALLPGPGSAALTALAALDEWSVRRPASTAAITSGAPFTADALGRHDLASAYSGLVCGLPS
jgi:hypothetical protein